MDVMSNCTAGKGVRVFL